MKFEGFAKLRAFLWSHPADNWTMSSSLIVANSGLMAAMMDGVGAWELVTQDESAKQKDIIF